MKEFITKENYKGKDIVFIELDKETKKKINKNLKHLSSQVKYNQAMAMIEASNIIINK